MSFIRKTISNHNGFLRKSVWYLDPMNIQRWRQIEIYERRWTWAIVIVVEARPDVGGDKEGWEIRAVGGKKRNGGDGGVNADDGVSSLVVATVNVDDWCSEIFGLSFYLLIIIILEYSKF